jgi:hypothetical protein
MIYEATMDAESFAGWECDACGGEIDTEDELAQLCAEPFNGSILTCPNDNCRKEYDLSITINIQEL